MVFLLCLTHADRKSSDVFFILSRDIPIAQTEGIRSGDFLSI